ncbi:MAG: magnesium chelatase family protein, partial [Planctomycetota bacterium]
RFSPLTADMRELLVRATERHGLSARAIQSLRRVARTLADLAGQELPGRAQLAEALALRATL